jgi:hypothetical protein
MMPSVYKTSVSPWNSGCSSSTQSHSSNSPSTVAVEVSRSKVPSRRSRSAARCPQSQPPRLIVIFSEEKCGVVAVGSIFIKQLIHRPQELARLLCGDRALAAQVGLQIGHQQSARDSLTCDIANDEAKPVLAQIQKIVIVSPHLPRLKTRARVFQSASCRHSLRKEPRLHLPCDFQFVRGATFRFDLLGDRAALRCNSECQFVEASKAE